MSGCFGRLLERDDDGPDRSFGEPDGLDLDRSW
jgi:hypothetical protein